LVQGQEPRQGLSKLVLPLARLARATVNPQVGSKGLGAVEKR